MLCNNPSKYGVVVEEETNSQRPYNILTPQGNRFFLKVIAFISDVMIYKRFSHIH